MRRVAKFSGNPEKTSDTLRYIRIICVQNLEIQYDMAKETKSQIPESNDNQKVMPFGKQNYIIVLVGIALIALGFVLMIGGGSSDPNVFNEKMFNTQRLTIAPILVLAGFVVEIVAIFWRKKQ